MAIKWLTPPREKSTKIIGNEITGTVEIAYFGGITTKEKEVIDEIIYDYTTPHTRISILAMKMAESEKVKDGPDGEERDLSPEEAFDVIIREIDSKNEDSESRRLAIKWAKEIAEEVKYLNRYSFIRSKATALAIIKHRLDESYTMEDLEAEDSRFMAEILSVAEEDSNPKNKEEKEKEDKVEPPTAEEVKKPLTEKAGPRK